MRAGLLVKAVGVTVFVVCMTLYLDEIEQDGTAICKLVNGVERMGKGLTRWARD